MSPVRLLRRRIVTDATGVERVLIGDAPLPLGFTERDGTTVGPIVVPAVTPVAASVAEGREVRMATVDGTVEVPVIPEQRHPVNQPGGAATDPGMVATVFPGATANPVSPAVPTATASEVPAEDAKVDAVLAYVGEDPVRARERLDLERSRPQADQRTTLIEKLTALAG